MKVKELPEETNLTQVKVKLPDEVFKTLEELSVSAAPEMYIAGSIMGDFFLSKDPPSAKSRSLCPILGIIDIPSITEWEVLGEEVIE